MSNDRTLIEPGQPCVGPDGHIPPILQIGADALSIVPRYRAPIPGFPDVMLSAEAAAVGNPCVGTLTQVYDDDDQLVAGPHAIAIRAHFEPPHPAAPRAMIATFRTNDGAVHTGLMEISAPEMLSLDRAVRLMDAWRTAVNSGQVVLTPPGRPTKVTADTAKTYAARVRRCYRAYVAAHDGDEPSQDDLVNEYGTELGYTSKRGLEEHLKKLRPFGYRWPEDYR